MNDELVLVGSSVTVLHCKYGAVHVPGREFISTKHSTLCAEPPVDVGKQPLHRHAGPSIFESLNAQAL
jgi:hypothetical protein